jgi:hypothetical protein
MLAAGFGGRSKGRVLVVTPRPLIGTSVADEALFLPESSEVDKYNHFLSRRCGDDGSIIPLEFFSELNGVMPALQFLSNEEWDQLNEQCTNWEQKMMGKDQALGAFRRIQDMIKPLEAQGDILTDLQQQDLNKYRKERQEAVNIFLAHVRRPVTTAKKDPHFMGKFRAAALVVTHVHTFGHEGREEHLPSLQTGSGETGIGDPRKPFKFGPHNEIHSDGSHTYLGLMACFVFVVGR